MPKGDYEQTPAQFRTEIEALYAHHFRPVTAVALVSRQFDLPADASPMVLTFDDSTTLQYAELPDGTVKPDRAVGILLAVAKQYGNDHPVSSFYGNAGPLASKDAYLAKLTALGMELGDHTATHASLRQLDGAGVQRELAQGLAVITGAVPAAKVTTMALPFGVEPHGQALAHIGTAAGTLYNFAAVLLVGDNPARSPYDVGFDPFALPRIRSGRRTGGQTSTSTCWLPQLFSAAVRPLASDGGRCTLASPR